MGDQPLSSLLLTHTHRVAYTLTEARSGPHALKPSYHTGQAPKGTLNALREEAREVLDKAFGVDGEQKRSAVLVLQRKVSAAWEGREVEAEMKRLLNQV